MFKGTYKGYNDINSLPTFLQTTLKDSFKINTNGISEFTTAQINAKASVMGLNQSLTEQLIALGNDATFSDKAKAGKLKFGEAIKDSANSTEDIAKALKDSGKLGESQLKQLERAALKGSNAYRNTISNMINANSDLADSFIKISDGSKQSKGIFSSTKDVFKGIAASIKPLIPLALAATAAFAAFKIVDYATHGYTRAFEDAKIKSEDYIQAREELQNLTNEYENQKSKIEELQVLKNNGSITMAQEIELEKLQSQNAELERQISLQEQLTNLKAGFSADSAKLASEKEMSYMEAMQKKHGKIKGWFVGAAGYMTSGWENSKLKQYNEKDTTQEGQIRSNIELLKDYEKQLDIVNRNLEKDPESKWYLKKQKEYQKNIADVKQELLDSSNVLEGWITQSTDINGNALPGMEEYVSGLKRTLNEVSNINKTQKEIDFNNISTFLNSSSSTLLKERLEEIVTSSGSAKEALKEFENSGLSLNDIDVSEEGFIRYFNDIKNSAQEASEEIEKVNNNLTVADLESAFSSKNAGDDYLELNNYIKQAKDLYDRGLVGTDDFKSVAELLSYNIDSSVESFKQNYDKLQRYFTELNEDNDAYSKKKDADNTTPTGILNFLNDLQAKGKEIAANDPARQYAESWAKYDDEAKKWTLNIDNTAEAAKELGVSVQVMEAILGRVQDYDNLGEFKFRSAIEDFDTAKQSLDGISELLDNMADGDRKNKLESQVEDWKKQLYIWENDLSTLDTDIVMKLKLEYDLASIQARIDEVQGLIDGGSSSVENYAQVISGNQKYLGVSKKNLNVNQDGIELPVEFKANEETISSLMSQLKYITDENEKIQVQAEIVNLQELNKDFLDAFSDAHPEINVDSSFEEVNTALNEFINSTEGKEIIAKINADSDKAFSKLSEINSISLDDKTIEINADDEASNIIDDVNKKELLDKKSALYSEDNATGVIYLWNALYANDKFATMSAEDQATFIISLWNQMQPEEKQAIITTSGGSEAEGDATDVMKAMAAIPNSYPEIKAHDDATSIITSVNSGLNSLNGKVSTSTVRVITENITRNLADNSSSPKYPLLSPRPKYNGTMVAPAHVNGKVSLPNNEKALVNEVSQESIVRDGTWNLIPGGAHIEQLKKGDIIFNASQTKQLLKYGKIAGHGKAYANGTVGKPLNAYAGTANGDLSFNIPSDSKYNSNSSTSKDKSKSKKKSSNSSSSTDKAKEFEEALDWIEIKIDRIERKIKNLERVAGSAFETYANRSKALAEQMGEVSNEITVQQQAYERYLQQANSISLSDDYKTQVQNGTIDISIITDEDLKKNIDDYKQW